MPDQLFLLRQKKGYSVKPVGCEIEGFIREGTQYGFSLGFENKGKGGTCTAEEKGREESGQERELNPAFEIKV